MPPTPSPTFQGIFLAFHNIETQEGVRGMITIEFTEEEKQALPHERFHHPHPRVQQKMEAVWLKSQELPHHTICQLTCISKPT
jgi:hypothetical protein